MEQPSSKALFTPAKTQRASEAIYNQIYPKIISGELRPGDRLPPERELAELLCGGKFLLQFAVSVLFCTPVFTKLHDALEERRLGGIGDGIVLLLFMLAVCEMMASGYNPFIYFRF